jgi:uncharacterized membrane protein YkoI
MKLTMIVCGLFFSLVAGSLSAAASPKDDNDAAEQAKWAKSAKITPHQAQRIAQKEVSGKILETDLDENDGVVVYDVVIYDGKTVKEITLNAKTGKVLKVAIDNEADQKLKDLRSN